MVDRSFTAFASTQPAMVVFGHCSRWREFCNYLKK